MISKTSWSVWWAKWVRMSRLQASRSLQCGGIRSTGCGVHWPEPSKLALFMFMFISSSGSGIGSVDRRASSSMGAEEGFDASPEDPMSKGGGLVGHWLFRTKYFAAFVGDLLPPCCVSLQMYTIECLLMCVCLRWREKAKSCMFLCFCCRLKI